jgi:D-glycero-beta-D-manno-heptose-7-phosphate kinase
MIHYEHLFESFKKLNVLIVGDVMIDRYLTGNVSRISPEAPVPVVHLQYADNRLGGAANVALNIKALGATPYLCSVTGQDADADVFFDLLPVHGLTAKGMMRSEERITTVKTRVIAGNQHLLRVDREDTKDLSTGEEKQYLNRVRTLLESEEIHVVLFQDYNKGVLSARVIHEIIGEAIKRNVPTAVDPKFNNFWEYKNTTLFKPNLREIQNQIPQSVTSELESLQKAANYVREKLNNPFTMITLSEKGLFIDERGDGAIVPTQPRDIVDVCGAGDAVIGIAALGLALALEMKEVAVLANIAGGLVCEHVGVAPVDSARLAAEYREFHRNKLLAD